MHPLSRRPVLALFLAGLTSFAALAAGCHHSKPTAAAPSNNATATPADGPPDPSGVPQPGEDDPQGVHNPPCCKH